MSCALPSGGLPVNIASVLERSAICSDHFRSAGADMTSRDIRALFNGSSSMRQPTAEKAAVAADPLVSLDGSSAVQLASLAKDTHWERGPGQSVDCQSLLRRIVGPTTERYAQGSLTSWPWNRSLWRNTTCDDSLLSVTSRTAGSWLTPKFLGA
jgi:hypothetical protein